MNRNSGPSIVFVLASRIAIDHYNPAKEGESWNHEIRSRKKGTHIEIYCHQFEWCLSCLVCWCPIARLRFVCTKLADIVVMSGFKFMRCPLCVFHKTHVSEKKIRSVAHEIKNPTIFICIYFHFSFLFRPSSQSLDYLTWKCRRSHTHKLECVSKIVRHP